MIDELELFYSDIEAPVATPQSLEFAKHIIKWKNRNLQMLPDDVLSYMIQEGLISETEVISLLIESFIVDKKTVDISLPKKYNI
jgi:hypothetical protein